MEINSTGFARIVDRVVRLLWLLERSLFGLYSKYCLPHFGSLEWSSYPFARSLDTGSLISQLISIVLLVRSLQLFPLVWDEVGHLRTL